MCIRDRGIPGPQGVPGAPGPAGPAGPGVAPSYFQAVTNGGAQDVAPQGEVAFLLSYQSGDFSFTPNTTTVTVHTAGVYRVDYTVMLRPANGLINAAYAVAINGMEHPLSFFGLYADTRNDTERAALTGMFIAAIPAGATVALRNMSANEDHLAGTGVDLSLIHI